MHTAKVLNAWPGHTLLNGSQFSFNRGTVSVELRHLRSGRIEQIYSHDLTGHWIVIWSALWWLDGSNHVDLLGCA